MSNGDSTDPWTTRIWALTKLVAAISALLLLIFNNITSCRNNSGIEQHSQQLGEIKTVVDDKAETIDKTAAKVQEVKEAVVKTP